MSGTSAAPGFGGAPEEGVRADDPGRHPLEDPRHARGPRQDREHGEASPGARLSSSALGLQILGDVVECSAAFARIAARRSR